MKEYLVLNYDGTYVTVKDTSPEKAAIRYQGNYSDTVRVIDATAKDLEVYQIKRVVVRKENG